jgi:hypothetical protein
MKFKPLSIILLALFIFACGDKETNFVGGVSEEQNAISGIVVDSEGRPIAGAEIILRDAAYIPAKNGLPQKKSATILVIPIRVNGYYTYSTRSDENGFWKISNMQAGRYSLEITGPNETAKRVKDIDVELNSFNNLAELKLENTGRIGGHVTLRWTQNTGVQVYLKGTDHSAMTIYTGEFVFESVAPGEYDLIIVSPDSSTYQAQSLTVDVQSGSDLIAGRNYQEIILPIDSEFGKLAWWSFNDLDTSGSLHLFKNEVNQTWDGWADATLGAGIQQTGLVLEGESALGVVENDSGIFDNVQSFSVEFMIRLDSLPQQTGSFNIFGKMGFTSDMLFSFAINQSLCGESGPELVYYLGRGDQVFNCANKIAGFPVQAGGQWLHVAGTWAPNRVALYLNGEPIYLGPSPVELFTKKNQSFYFGNQTESFSAVLDEVKIYNYDFRNTDALARSHEAGGSHE